MTCFTDISEHWLGLCRKLPSVHTSPAGINIPPEPAHEGQPDGSRNRPGRIYRGIGSALSGMRTLIQNRQLLWFPLLAGLLLAANTFGQSALPFIGWTMEPYILAWIVQDFFIEFATLFCLVFLSAGLVLSLSSKKEGPASFFEGLTGAKEYLNAIFWWSAILASAGMLIFLFYTYSAYWLPRNIPFLDIFRPNILLSLLSQFPFNFALEPKMLTRGFTGEGGRLLLRWVYPSGFMDTLVFSIINLFLFVLTPFVVPLIVIGQKTLREAVAGSFTLVRTARKEVAACAIFLGIIVFGVFLAYLLVQVAHGAPIVTGYTTTAWIALGLLYDLLLLSVALVMATVGGIAALDLYTTAKTGQVSRYTKPESWP